MKAWIVGLGVWNLVTLGVYGWDKWRAIRGGRRVSEATLIGLAAALGFAGAWIGVHVFRHKRSKRSFLVRLTLATLLDVVLAACAAWWTIRS